VKVGTEYQLLDRLDKMIPCGYCDNEFFNEPKLQDKQFAECALI